jgi:hypothetical protein
MAETFDCPKCGAPIDFDPAPGDETVECAFCHETVIIPEDLRVPLPPVAVERRPQPRGRRNGTGVTIAVIVIAAICIGIAIANPGGRSTDDAPTDIAIDLPTIDIPTLDLTGATATVEAQATSEALQPLFKQEQGWPASFSEKYRNNDLKWQTGDVRDSYISGNRSISDGIYTWNITAVQSASDFSLPDMPDQQDFYASLDIKYLALPDDPDADAGLVFRYNGTDQTWYYFSVNDSGAYYFGWYDGKSWYSLIPQTDTSAYHPGQTNRLSVGVQGSQFIFAINGQMVDHFVDENLKSGTIGVGVNLPKTGEKATVQFSNFTVLAPSPSQ